MARSPGLVVVSNPDVRRISKMCSPGSTSPLFRLTPVTGAISLSYEGLQIQGGGDKKIYSVRDSDPRASHTSR